MSGIAGSLCEVERLQGLKGCPGLAERKKACWQPIHAMHDCQALEPCVSSAQHLFVESLSVASCGWALRWQNDGALHTFANKLRGGFIKSSQAFRSPSEAATTNLSPAKCHHRHHQGQISGPEAKQLSPQANT